MADGRSRRQWTIEMFHGLMPSDNPFLGNFQHSPSADNERSKYFVQHMTSFDDYLRKKALRHNPYTGLFHSGLLHHVAKYQNIVEEGFDFDTSDAQWLTSVHGDDFRKNSLYIHSVENDECTWLHSDTFVRKEEEKLERDLPEVDSDEKRSMSDASFGTNLHGFSDQAESLKTTIAQSVHSGEWLENRSCSSCLKDTLETHPKIIDCISRNVRNANADLTNIEASCSDDLVLQFGRLPLVCSMGELTEKGDFFDLKKGHHSSMQSPSDNQSVLSRACSVDDAIDMKRTGKSQHFLLNNFANENEDVVHEGPVSLPFFQTIVPSMDSIKSPQNSSFVNSAYDIHPDLPWVVNRMKPITEKYKIDLTNKGDMGKGTYSVVRLCRDRMNNEYCVKIVKKRLLVSTEEKHMIQNEIDIHQALNHRHIIRLHEIFEDTNRLFLVLEPAYGGTLEDFLHRSGGFLPEKHCRSIFKQLLHALLYLHGAGVLQGDIKPSNFLLSKPHSTGGENDDSFPWDIRICDFGLSRKVPDIKYYKFTGDVNKVPFTSVCGTMGYMAPEILLKEDYTVAADIWSAGIVLYEMLSGLKPFVPYSDCLLVSLRFPKCGFEAISFGATSLVRKLLVVRPEQRITAKDGLKSEWLSHTWSSQ